MKTCALCHRKLGLGSRFRNKWPYHSQILQWAKAAKPNDGPVVIAVGSRLTVIAPEGEFPLGEFNEADQIVRKFSDRLVAVDVVKSQQRSA